MRLTSDATSQIVNYNTEMWAHIYNDAIPFEVCAFVSVLPVL